MTEPSGCNFTPKIDSMTNSHHSPAEEQDQSIRYGNCGGAFRAPPSTASTASSTTCACPGGPWRVVRASPGNHSATVPAPPNWMAALVESAGHAG